MKFTSRPALLFASCATLAITQVYACGIELDTAPDTDAGSGSSSSGLTSSGTPMASSSSGSSTSGSTSSGGSSGEPPEDAGSDATVACSEVVLTGTTDIQCPTAAQPAPFTYQAKGHTITCARGGGATPTADVLTNESVLQNAGFWVQVGRGATSEFDIEATVEASVTNSAVGAGFAVVLVSANADAGATPTTGGVGPTLGFSQLTGFAGVAAALQTYNSQVLTGSPVPNAAFGTGLGALPPATGTYRVALHHDAGAGQPIVANAFLGDTPVNLLPVVIALTPAVSNTIGYVGVTAATGSATKSQQRLVSLRLRLCDPTLP